MRTLNRSPMIDCTQRKHDQFSWKENSACEPHVLWILTWFTRMLAQASILTRTHIMLSLEKKSHTHTHTNYTYFNHRARVAHIYKRKQGLNKKRDANQSWALLNSSNQYHSYMSRFAERRSQAQQSSSILRPPHSSTQPSARISL